MTEPKETPALLTVSAEQYGEGYREHLLEQYKLYVDSASQISDRRTSANNYLLTVSTTLVTLFALSASLVNAHLLHVALAVAGVLVCVTWFVLIRSYRDLNTAKFAVIHELEQQLPVSLFAYEWHLAQRGRGKAYRPLTHIEPFIPALFAILFVIIGVYSLTASPTHGTETSPPSLQNHQQGQSENPIP